MKTVVDEESFLTLQMEPGNGYVVSFKVFEIAALGDTPEYVRADSKTGNDWTQDTKEAQVHCSGDIKWDGCCNMKFDEQETVMLHYCGNPAKRFARMFELLYKMAAELMPGNGQYLGET